MKLIRDLVPDYALTANGEVMDVRSPHDAAEFDSLLDAKLDEELAEWHESHDPMELADLLEVIRKRAARAGVGWDALLDLAAPQTRRTWRLRPGSCVERRPEPPALGSGQEEEVVLPAPGHHVRPVGPQGPPAA
jgi:predicted house-cleaning noncanonical NTP pyrophosphatase (MazG superfamily)